MIPCSNPLAQYLAQRTEIDAAIARVAQSGWYILGAEVRAFESEFAAYVDARHGIGVGSGTEALHVALAACGVGSDDEVVTVSHTAVATVAAVELAGARPVLVDIEPNYYTLDLRGVERALTPRTKAIIAVHLYGQPADMDAIMNVAGRRGIRVIEDCAQAHGARFRGRRVGGIGDVGCFSFYPTKNLGALGDGGMIVTRDDQIAERARLLREYGWSERYTSAIAGWNTRLDELQAAILRVKLVRLDAANTARRRLADRYNAGLAGLPLVLPARRPQTEHVFHLYVVRTAARDALLAHLKRSGVGALIHYPIPVHQQPAYVGRLGGAQTLPQTEAIAREVLSLPMFPELSEDEQSETIAAVRRFFG